MLEPIFSNKTFWDSINNIFHFEKFPEYSLDSLRSLLKKSEPVTQTVEVNEKEDVEEKVQEKEETRESDVDTKVTLTQGIRKQVIRKNWP